MSHPQKFNRTPVIREQYSKALEILTGQKGILKKGADLLLEKEKIEGEELKALMEASSPNSKTDS